MHFEFFNFLKFRENTMKTNLLMKSLTAIIAATQALSSAHAADMTGAGSSLFILLQLNGPRHINNQRVMGWRRGSGS